MQKLNEDVYMMYWKHNLNSSSLCFSLPLMLMPSVAALLHQVSTHFLLLPPADVGAG